MHTYIDFVLDLGTEMTIQPYIANILKIYIA